jgi:mannonate dehydratase
MILTEFLPPRPHPLWALARQLGVTHAIVKANPTLTGRNPPWDIDVLRDLQRALAAEGLTLVGLEGDQFDMSRIKLGRDGRDEDIARYGRMLRNMGELGVGLLCYNFMAQIGWCRSGAEPTRGGALATRFRLADMPRSTPLGEVPAEAIWENYTYFLRCVLPDAERAGVTMALHPDDPPLPSLCGVGRIFHTPEAFDRALDLMPSPSNAITFCQANFQLMGVDLEACIRRFGSRGKIAFVHVRDVRGTADDFVETFHDDGPTDMVAMFRLYHEVGFDGPLRCDHVPTMAGEGGDDAPVPGYGTLGRLFAVGYFKGIMDALGIPRR